MPAFAVTGATTPLGARVLAALAPEGGAAPLSEGIEAPDLHGCRCLVSLAVGPGPSPALDGPGPRLADLRRALTAAQAAGLTRVVHLSSAVVYGASADNPVPLPEDAPLRPDPRFPWAVELAEAERLVAEWRDAAAGRSAAVLRPALVVAPDDDGGLARALGGLGGLGGLRAAGETRPVQLVHVDDVAAAVAVCATAVEPVDGCFNVAPEGWVSDSEVAALAGSALPQPSIPARLVGPVRRLFWALGLGATPPEAEAYATHPWVVAADHLRSLGWAPTHSSEEALVATTSCSALAALPPGRRQELLLATTATLVVALVGAAIALAARSLRRTRR